jgi:prevent-host-death family protein
MDSISQRTMRNDSSAVLRRVASGESLVVTNDGTPTAVIAPYEPDPVMQLTRLGRLRPATRRLRVLEHPLKPSISVAQAAEWDDAQR